MYIDAIDLAQPGDYRGEAIKARKLYSHHLHGGILERFGCNLLILFYSRLTIGGHFLDKVLPPIYNNMGHFFDSQFLYLKQLGNDRTY